MCEIAAKIRKKYVIGQYSYYSLAYSNLIYFTISWSTKLNYIILRTERALTERAPTGQQAHSPGQSAAAPRESNIANSRALKGQKHKNIWNVKM